MNEPVDIADKKDVVDPLRNDIQGRIPQTHEEIAALMAFDNSIPDDDKE